MRAPRAIVVGLVSAGTLAFEILLVRVFAIGHFHHFATMAIGVAMLGFGVAGILMAMRAQGRAATGFVPAVVITVITLMVVPFAVLRISIDTAQLFWDAGQWPRLATVYALLATPFLAGGLVVLTALAGDRDHPGRIYGASFVGSGLGVALSLAALAWLPAAQALAVPAVLAGVGAIFASPEKTKGVSGKSTRRWAASAWRVAGWAALAAALVSCAAPPWPLPVTSYKALPQIEAFPDARRIAERTGPVGWVVAVDAPAFRYAPGLSLRFEGSFPDQSALLVDGQLAGAATRGDDEQLEFLEWLPSAAPYALGRHEQVLVLGAGDATEVLIAARHGTSQVTAVELNCNLVSLGRELSNTGGSSEVEWKIADVRSFMARSDRRFDLVVLPAGGGPGASMAGAHALSADFLHTVEAYAAYLERLSPNGILSITRWLTVPPREGVRTLLTVVEALRRFRPAAVAQGLVVVRSWGTTTVLARPSGFTSAAIDSLRTWCTVRGFDLVWHPGIEGYRPGLHELDEPTFFQAAEAATSGPQAARRFAQRYPFDVTPVGDARPYPHHFFRAASLRVLLERGPGSWLPVAEWGYLALLATLLQSIVLAALLVLIPLAARRRAVPAAKQPDAIPWSEKMSYFAAIGLAYLAAEIAAIQHLSLMLGHPVYAVAAVLATFLIFSGLGSVWSERVSVPRAWTAAAWLTLAIVVLALLLLPVVQRAQSMPLITRAVIAIIVLAPPAFLMGMPFPLGIRALLRQDQQSLPWAWTVNAFASVIAAPLSGLIALESGTAVLFLVAAGAYAVTAVILKVNSSEPRLVS